MKVLITGGTGFVGPHVVRAVAGAGHDLRLLVRDSTRSRELPGQPVVGEMTNTVSLQHAVEGVDEARATSSRLRKTRASNASS